MEVLVFPLCSRLNTYGFSIFSFDGECLGLFTRIVLDETAVEVSQLLASDVSGCVFRGFEVQVVHPIAEELRCSHVHTDDDFVRISRLLNGSFQQFQCCRRTFLKPINQHEGGL